MNKIIRIIAFLVCVVNATERVNVSCYFDAKAEGYSDKEYSQNLLNKDGTLYNSDGTGGKNKQPIYGSGVYYERFAFGIYDGATFHGIKKDNMVYGFPYSWSLNTGDVDCVLNSGWVGEYYKEPKYVIRDTVYKYKTDTIYLEKFLKPSNIHDTIIKIRRDTIQTTIRDTVVKIVKDSVFDSSKATVRFSLKGKYIGLATNEIDCEFYTHFLKYNDSVFNEMGDYVDSFEINLVYLSGSYYKTIKLDRATILTLINHPAVYPTRKGNYFITTELNWNESSIKDWSQVKTSTELQEQINKLRSEIGR